MKTDERLLVDARTTWKPYRVAYEIIRALRPLTAGSGPGALLIRKGEWRRSDRVMTVIMSTASLGYGVYPWTRHSPGRYSGWT